MEAFVPIINLAALLSALSIAAERLANALKLSKPKVKEAKWKRERRINRAVLQVSVLLAFLVKADFFAILAHLEAPWDTLEIGRAHV